MYDFLPNFRKIKTNSGYTLIELLVVISIIALVFSGVTVSYRSYQKKQSFDALFRQVLADIRLAQSFALSGKVGPETNDCPTFEGYVFSGDASNTKYHVYRNCGTTHVTEYKSVTLPTGFTITVRGQGSTDIDFMFQPLGRGLDVEGHSACVTVRQGSVSKIIKINQTTGNVEVATNCP